MLTFKVFHSLNFEFQRGILITHKHSVAVLLESRYCPHVVDTFFNGFVQSKGFVGSCDKNHHLDRETQRVAVRVYKTRSERAHPHPAELRES